jgi:hypothetical protein
MHAHLNKPRSQSLWLILKISSSVICPNLQCVQFRAEL